MVTVRGALALLPECTFRYEAVHSLFCYLFPSHFDRHSLYLYCAQSDCPIPPECAPQWCFRNQQFVVCDVSPDPDWNGLFHGGMGGARHDHQRFCQSVAATLFQPAALSFRVHPGQGRSSGRPAFLYNLDSWITPVRIAGSTGGERLGLAESLPGERNICFQLVVDCCHIAAGIGPVSVCTLADSCHWTYRWHHLRSARFC